MRLVFNVIDTTYWNFSSSRLANNYKFGIPYNGLYFIEFTVINSSQNNCYYELFITKNNLKNENNLNNDVLATSSFYQPQYVPNYRTNINTIIYLQNTDNISFCIYFVNSSNFLLLYTDEVFAKIVLIQLNTTNTIILIY